MTHIFPTSENHEESTTCSCYPRVVIENGDTICIHQSFTGKELLEDGFQIGAKANVKSRCGRDLIEGDIVESVQGTRFMVLTFMGLKGFLMLPNQKVFQLSTEMSPNLFFIGNVIDDMQLRSSFFYGS